MLPEKASIHIRSITGSWDLYCDYNWQRNLWVKIFNFGKKNFPKVQDKLEKARHISITNNKDEDGELLFRLDMINYLSEKVPDKKISRAFTKNKSSGSIHKKDLKTSVILRSPHRTNRYNKISVTGMNAINKVEKWAEAVQRKTRKNSTIYYFDIKEIGSDNLHKLQEILTKNKKPDLLECFIDLHNFSSIYHINQEEVKKQGCEIINKWFDKPTILEHVTPLLLPIDIYTPDMFDTQITELQIILNKFYVNTLPQMPATGSPLWSKKLSQRLSKRFDEDCLLPQHRKMMMVFRRYLKKLHHEEWLNCYIELRNFKERLFLTNNLEESATAILSYLTDLDKKGIFSIMELWYMEPNDEYSQNMFDPIIGLLSNLLNNDFQDLLLFYQDLRELET